MTDPHLTGKITIERIIDYVLAVADQAFPPEWAETAKEVLQLGKVPCSVAMIWGDIHEVLRFGAFRAKLMMQAIAFMLSKPGMTTTGVDSAGMNNLKAELTTNCDVHIDTVGSHDINQASKEAQKSFWMGLVASLGKDSHALRELPKWKPPAAETADGDDKNGDKGDASTDGGP
eukprot:385493-Pyramimonas_sp.AAC.1